MIRKLRELLATMTQEEFDRDWAAIKAKGLKGPTAKELIASFRLLPTYQFVQTKTFQTESSQAHLSFDFKSEEFHYAMAA